MKFKAKLLEQVRALLDSEGISFEYQTLSDFIENIVQNDHELYEVLIWIKNKQKECEAVVEQIGLNEVTNGAWIINEFNGDVEHISGGFFKIIGVDVRTDQRESGMGWKQPMIEQGTESSIVGFIRRKNDGLYQYLVEAKFEPGNYGKVLISPSLQVTFSNLNRAHGGKKPKYAEYFDGSLVGTKCIYSQWLPEDGGRFYLKRVKYMIVEVDEKLMPMIEDNFRWVSVNTLKRILHLDNLINPHVRSLLAVL